MPMVQRWNGSSWALQSLTLPAGATNSALSGIACNTTTTCTAVGYYESAGNPRRTMALRMSGTTWSSQTGVNPSGATLSELQGVACTSSTSCNAVGDYLDATGVGHSLAEIWNGSTWTEVDAPWSAPALVFDPIGNPPDDLPYVIGVMTSRPKTCDVELLTGSPSANGTVLNAGTWIGGVDGNGLGAPTGCAPAGPTQEQVVQWLKVVAFCRAVQFYRTIAFFEHMDRIFTARRRAAAVIRAHRRAATTHRR
jgi:hypothetical protein